jgi:cbb3-type cytochrome oxidase maturation protein
MSVIFLLVIIGVVVAGLFLGGFIWAVKNGQYDDTYTPSVRMLFEEGPAVKSGNVGEAKNSDTEKKKAEVEKSK